MRPRSRAAAGRAACSSFHWDRATALLTAWVVIPSSSATAFC